MASEVIKCGPVLGIAEFEVLYPTLLSLLLEEQSIVFDCGDIEQVDTAALQLLHAFFQEAKIHGKSVNWDNVSDIFLQSARVLGIAHLMEDGVSLNVD